jgi:hypothetical protein
MALNQSAVLATDSYMFAEPVFKALRIRQSLWIIVGFEVAPDFYHANAQLQLVCLRICAYNTPRRLVMNK